MSDFQFVLLLFAIFWDVCNTAAIQQQLHLRLLILGTFIALKGEKVENLEQESVNAVLNKQNPLVSPIIIFLVIKNSPVSVLMKTVRQYDGILTKRDGDYRLHNQLIKGFQLIHMQTKADGKPIFR